MTSYNPCNDLSAFAGCSFPGSDITENFSLGKTKSRRVNASPFHTVSFERLSTEMQICHMDVGARIRNEMEVIAATLYFDSKFTRQPNAHNL